MDDPKDNRETAGPKWPPSDRETAGSVANLDARITVFSIRALGYDPESSDPKPREVLEWGRRRQAAERSRNQILGAVITAVITAVVGGVCWPLIQHLFHGLGP
jgi:hypothetical protein